MSTAEENIAREAADRALAEGRAMGLEGPVLMRHIQAAYPFDTPNRWLRHVWLVEVDRAFIRARPEPG